MNLHTVISLTKETTLYYDKDLTKIAGTIIINIIEFANVIVPTDHKQIVDININLYVEKSSLTCSYIRYIKLDIS